MEVLLAATTTARVEVEATPAASSSPAKELTEDVVEVHVVEVLASAASWLALALFVLSHPVLALLVVDAALVLI